MSKKTWASDIISNSFKLKIREITDEELMVMFMNRDYDKICARCNERFGNHRKKFCRDDRGEFSVEE